MILIIQEDISYLRWVFRMNCWIFRAAWCWRRWLYVLLFINRRWFHIECRVLPINIWWFHLDFCKVMMAKFWEVFLPHTKIFVRASKEVPGVFVSLGRVWNIAQLVREEERVRGVREEGVRVLWREAQSKKTLLVDSLKISIYGR